MDIRVVSKIPLIKIRKKVTEDRMIKQNGHKLCVVYSEHENAFKKGDSYVESIELAEMDDFSKLYYSTKDETDKGIIYLLIKI